MSRIGSIVRTALFSNGDTNLWLIPIILVIVVGSFIFWKKKTNKKRVRWLWLFVFVLVSIGIVVKDTTVFSTTLSGLITNKETGSNKTNATNDKKNVHTNHSEIKRELRTAWQSVDQKDSGEFAIAILQNDGQVVSYTTTESTFATASIVKVSIAAELLHNNATDQVALSSTQDDLLTAMMEESDNDAATTLLTDDLGGYASLSAIYQALAMTNTTVDTDAWGYTQTTAEDQLKLLSAIFEPSDYLTTNSQTYLQTLMNTVTDSQVWGVSQGAANVYLKNGWLQDEDGWIVNSIGKVDLDKAGEESYLIAVLTKNNPTFADGQALIEKLTAKTNAVLSK